MDWSRKRLARELCVLWDWRNGTGRLKDFAARSFLLKLAERELIELPPVREYKRSGPQTVGWVKADFEHTPEPLCAELEQVRPVQLDWVEAGSDWARRVAFYLDRYHYLGWHVVGQNIGYLARDGLGRDLAVLLFGAAAWRCAPRDRHLAAQPRRWTFITPASVYGNWPIISTPMMLRPHAALSNRCYTSCVTVKVHASSRASKKYSQRHLFKMTRHTMTQPTLSSNVRSNTSSITVIILITKLWLSVALRSDPVQWSHNAASSKIVSSAPASSGRGLACATSWLSTL